MLTQIYNDYKTILLFGKPSAGDCFKHLSTGVSGCICISFFLLCFRATRLLDCKNFLSIPTIYLTIFRVRVNLNPNPNMTLTKTESRRRGSYSLVWYYVYSEVNECSDEWPVVHACRLHILLRRFRTWCWRCLSFVERLLKAPWMEFSISSFQIGRNCSVPM